jgi:riboflavin synthase
MFTGIVQARGAVKSIEPHNHFVRISIVSDWDFSDVGLGDSIAVNGACLTATQIIVDAKEFRADVSPETFRVTTLGDLKIGDEVNLEKALRLDSRLGGHLVAGHVDCVGRIIEKRIAGAGFLMGFMVDSGRYLIEKGSVAIDGVSLTINRVQDRRLWVMIIPHTSGLTGLTEKNVNDRVNIEFDLVGKYIEKLITSRGSTPDITEEKLREHGFM